MSEILDMGVIALFSLGIGAWYYIAKGDLSDAEKDRLLERNGEPMLWEPPDPAPSKNPKDSDENS